MTTALFIAAGLAAFAAIMTLLNILVWPRGRAGKTPSTSFSALIPARNEESSLRACLRSVVASPAVAECWVCDDGSTDTTPNILREEAAADARIRSFAGAPLADGWIGKPHACWQLAARASNDVLLFVDADVELDPRGVERIGSLMEDLDADVLTAVPRQRTETFVERLVLPLLHITYTSWLFLPLIWRSRDVRFMAANGQILAIRRAAYDAIGGFAAVRNEVVDDMAICRLAKAQGHRVVFADGFSIATCRMYESASGVWRGFSKNLYEGIGGHIGALLGVLTLYFAAFVFPYVGLAAAALGATSLWLPSLIGVAANLILRGAMAARHRQPWLSVLLHPFGVLVLLAIAVNSWRWTTSNRVQWAGRTYAARSQRGVVDSSAEPAAPSDAVVS